MFQTRKWRTKLARKYAVFGHLDTPEHIKGIYDISLLYNALNPLYKLNFIRSQCFCISQYNQGLMNTYNSTACSYPCTGDSSKTCGGLSYDLLNMINLNACKCRRFMILIKFQINIFLYFFKLQRHICKPNASMRINRTHIAFYHHSIIWFHWARRFAQVDVTEVIMHLFGNKTSKQN